MQEKTYYIKGMHCASCEVLIEKKLLEIPGVKSVDASTAKSQATIEYDQQVPSLQQLNEAFKQDNYTFSENKYEVGDTQKEVKLVKKTLIAFSVAIGIVTVFLLLDKVGVSSLLSVGSRSSVFAFFGFGVLAGLSSCAALVGGIVLSMSKQWNDLYVNQTSSYKKFEPHAIFNIGRILSYALGGGLLGLIGSRLQLSLGLITFLIIAISILMIGLGLQMLGVPGFRKFQFSAPKSITRYIANENNFKGKYMPFIMGALTFFLPCGFTITAQTIALLSGNALQSALIMGFFALGTTPMLLIIGLSSVKFFSKPNVSEIFSKLAGFLVIFFALFNIINKINI
ncbi:MAG: hypothetical protein EXS48_01615 [Candidatus Staskawiczbacteria bacterium]|nr:hypothetical protein [Candidatus Staskawiczbacteria bacterium]